MKLYIGVGGRENNDMALKENNSNEEPTTGAVAIQIVLAMSTCLPHIAYRIMMGRLIKQPPTLWPHNGPTNPQSHCYELCLL